MAACTFCENGLSRLPALYPAGEEEEERPITQASQRSNADGVMVSPMTACGKGHAYAANHACHENH